MGKWLRKGALKAYFMDVAGMPLHMTRAPFRLTNAANNKMGAIAGAMALNIVVLHPAMIGAVTYGTLGFLGAYILSANMLAATLSITSKNARGEARAFYPNTAAYADSLKQTETAQSMPKPS